MSGQSIWPKPGEWRVLGVIAGLFAVQIGAMNIGYANTTAVMGAVLIASNPVFAVVFAHFLVAGDRMHALKAIGLLLGFAGTAIVLLEDAGADQIQLSAWGNWVVLFSACLLGLRLGLSAKALRSIDPVRVALWQMLIALPLFGIAAASLETIRWEALDWPPVLGLLFQGVVIAGVCFVAQFRLMQRYSPSLMVSFNFVSPIAGVLFGVWLLNESVGAFLFWGLLLVTVGLVMIARPSSAVARQGQKEETG